MSESRSRRTPRVLAAVAASATLLSVGSVATGGPARADTGGPAHSCGLFNHDDGPLSGPVHHTVEPALDPYLGTGVAHQLNCATVGYVDFVIRNLSEGVGP